MDADLKAALESTKAAADSLSAVIAKALAITPPVDPPPPNPEPVRGVIPSPKLSTGHPDWPAYSSLVKSTVASGKFGFQIWDYRPTQLLYWWDADGRRDNSVRDYCIKWFEESLKNALIKWANDQDLNEFSDNQYLDASYLVRDWCLCLNWCGDQLTTIEKSNAEIILARCIENMRTPVGPDGYVPATWGPDRKPYPWAGWGQNNPGNNYWYNHLEAVVHWAIHSQDKKWLDEAIKMIGLATHYFASVEGGGSLEGTGYGKSQKTLFRVLWTWQQATGQSVNVRQAEHIAYWIAQTTPDFKSGVAIGDQAMQSMPTIESASGDYLRACILWAARLVESPEAWEWLRKDTHAHHWLDYWELCNFPLTYNINSVAKDPPPSYFAEAAGHLFARDEAANALLAVTAGDVSEAHMGQCQGEFQFYLDGQWIGSSNLWSKSGIRQDMADHCVPQVGAAQDKTKLCSLSYTDDNGILTAIATLSPAYPKPLLRKITWDRVGGKILVNDTDGTFRVFCGTKPQIDGTIATVGATQLRASVTWGDSLPIVTDMATVDPDDFAPETCWRIDFNTNGGIVEITYKQPPVPTPTPEPPKMLAPLDTADGIWRAQAPDANNQIPSEGVQAYPLTVQGGTPFVTDHLEIRVIEPAPPGVGQQWLDMAVPKAKLSGDFTLSIRFIPRSVSTTVQQLGDVVDWPNQTNAGKRMMAYLDTNNRLFFRLFDTNGATKGSGTPPAWISELSGTTACALGQQVDATFRVKSGKIAIFKNGVLENEITLPANFARGLAQVDLLRCGVPNPTILANSTKTKIDFIANLFWPTGLENSDIANIPAALTDLLAGSPPPPPPPPPPGTQRFVLNGADVATMSITKNGSSLIGPPPATGEDVYQVDTA